MHACACAQAHVCVRVLVCTHMKREKAEMAVRFLSLLTSPQRGAVARAHRLLL